VWELYLDEVRDLTRVRDRVLRKRDYAAGLAEDRVRNKADELSKWHPRPARRLTALLSFSSSGAVTLIYTHRGCAQGPPAQGWDETDQLSWVTVTLRSFWMPIGSSQPAGDVCGDRRSG
jgi:hypothetical protein